MGSSYLHWTRGDALIDVPDAGRMGHCNWIDPRLRVKGRRGGDNSSASWFWWSSGHVQTVWIEKDIIRGLISVGDFPPDASKSSSSRHKFCSMIWVDCAPLETRKPLNHAGATCQSSSMVINSQPGMASLINQYRFTYMDHPTQWTGC